VLPQKPLFAHTCCLRSSPLQLLVTSIAFSADEPPVLLLRCVPKMKALMRLRSTCTPLRDTCKNGNQNFSAMHKSIFLAHDAADRS